MKTLITNLKKPDSIKTLGLATVIFMTVLIFSFGVLYLVFNVFLTESLIVEVDKNAAANTEQTADFVRFIGVFIASQITTFVATVIAMVVAYKKIFVGIKRILLKPSERANLVTIIFALAGLAAIVASSLLILLMPYPYAEEAGVSASPGAHPFEYVWYLVFAIIVLSVVHFFARRRAIREKKDELLQYSSF